MLDSYCRYRLSRHRLILLVRLIVLLFLVWKITFAAFVGVILLLFSFVAEFLYVFSAKYLFDCFYKISYKLLPARLALICAMFTCKK